MAKKSTLAFATLDDNGKPQVPIGTSASKQLWITFAAGKALYMRPVAIIR
jgi:hypothetical protein